MKTYEEIRDAFEDWFTTTIFEPDPYEEYFDWLLDKVIKDNEYFCYYETVDGDCVAGTKEYVLSILNQLNLYTKCVYAFNMRTLKEVNVRLSFEE